MLFDREDYERWLVDEGYQTTTIGVYAATAERIAVAAEAGEELPHERNIHYAAKSIQKYVLATGVPVEEHLAYAVADLVVDPHEGLGAVKKRRLRQKKRKREAKSFSDTEWRSLIKVLDDSTGPEAAVIAILAATGLRIGDVLTLTRAALRQGLDRGYIAITVKGGDERMIAVSGSPDEWKYLADIWVGEQGSNVLTLISPNASPNYYLGHPSYHRVSDALHELADRAGITSHPHLHRIRRTVAVQAFRLGGNMVEVQQMLGHKSLSTTQSYLDEARPDDVADLQRKVRQHFT